MINEIINKYNNYKVNNLPYLRVKHKDIEIIIHNLDKKIFEIDILGQSFEQRNIYKIKIGWGKTKILFWSQMHGNEAVGTLSIFDLFNFFQKNDEFNDIKNQILNNCTLYFVPMLNPDGAEIYERRNAQGIDLNRDAVKLTAPESQILEKLLNELKPDFGLNLHDQEIYYGNEKSNFSTALSFLTPSFDYEKTIDESRKKSMLLISDVYENLQCFLPQKIAKYNDNYMPNAFGDNTQKKGISTILVEAGYIQDDIERQEVRKYYFYTLLYSMFSISKKTYLEQKIEKYFDIPMNVKLKFCDIILLNLNIKRNNQIFQTDISIIRDITDTEKFTDFEENYLILDIGDLKNKFAFQIIDCQGFTIVDEEKKIFRLKKANFLLNSFINKK